MTKCFHEREVRIFDHPKWAERWRDAIRENMERIAAENGMQIEFIRSKKKFRQEKRIKEVLDKRGEEPGWCAFCRRWSRAAAASRGTTSGRTRRT